MPPRSWVFRIRDIIDAIDRVADYSEGIDEKTFIENSMIVDAVLRNFIVIGEAIRHVPAEIRDRHEEIPWLDVQDMRNIVVHEYFGVSLPIVWHTAIHDLPTLRDQLQPLLAESDSDLT
jgi:uncharacterized protein with HEPN domain